MGLYQPNWTKETATAIEAAMRLHARSADNLQQESPIAKTINERGKNLQAMAQEPNRNRKPEPSEPFFGRFLMGLV